MLIVQLASATSQQLSFLQFTSYCLSGSAALASVLVILLMPFRYVHGGDKEVSSVGSLPNDQARSPEDGLRLWQFLTVYWMSPLIKIGRTRKLNEEDVWLLAFEFQHSRLFETFQTLKGSVLGRIIRANAVDIFIISILSLIDLACSK
jgi:hypothetical protein